MAPAPARRSSPRSRRRNDSALTGQRTEAMAAWLLRAKGYRILARRFRAGSGEIDLIAARGGIVAIVEVKARRQMDEALAAISQDKLRRVAHATAIWLARHPSLAQRTIRFDAIFISDASLRAILDGSFRLPRHIPNIANLPLHG